MLSNQKAKEQMNKILKTVIAVLPAFAITALVVLSVHLSYSALATDPFFSVLISSEIENDRNNKVLEPELVLPDSIEFPNGIVHTDDEFEAIGFATQWASLNVEGWATTDIPIYFGDTAEILANGAGQWIGSYFCGHEKTCIVSANVATWFYELEDTEIGAEVTMQTTYGNYRYEAVDMYTFARKDIDMLYEDLGEDTLILYTSYPRSGDVSTNTQCIALECKLKDGTIYKNKFESKEATGNE